MNRLLLITIITFFLALEICFAGTIVGSKGSILKARVVANFSNPWSLAFIDNDWMLVSSKQGQLWLVSKNGEKVKVTGVPKVAIGGQGGLGDIVPHPNFLNNKLIYLSYVEAKGFLQPRGAVVIRGTLKGSRNPTLTNLERIWTQIPKTGGSGHFSHRIVFGPKGSAHEGKIFITSGDRQRFTVAQDWNKNLGKIIRLNEDGSVPLDNPFQDQGELAKSFWTLGHRNALGIDFDSYGRLWSHEMGPWNGDEFNLILPGKNYGWPLVSEGKHYNGEEIPKHSTRPELNAPVIHWIPTIAPSGLFFYSGNEFPNWKGNAFLGGLKSKALIRVEVKGTRAKESERFSWGQRVREVEEAPDGSIWILEDPPKGRLIELTSP